MITHLLYGVYSQVIIHPLRLLYFYGPSFMQFGFWGGSATSEICRTVTSHSELFWIDHPSHCQEIVETKFASFRITSEVVVYFLIMYHLARNIGQLCLCVRECCFCPRRVPVPSHSIIYIHDPPPLDNTSLRNATISELYTASD